MTPEELLHAVRTYENKQGKGHLKIFLGMAPGVGKTYAMLESAQKKQKEGASVAVGWVETHQRSDTAKLLAGLPLLPGKTLLYREKEFTEFDLDQALSIKPQLILVDELAHTNIPGSRHEKRWQDVLELLDANIDVYTTLNVQHVENFKDMIQEIVKIKITETVPNQMLELASDIELVDLTPQELLERLKEGKVYTGDMPKVAIENFFQEERLTALRELSLLLTADLVDKELRDMFALLQKKKGWKSKDKLLVAIDPELNAQQLIRIASQQAFRLHAPWIALYVDTGKELTAEAQEILTKNLTLARDLGAEVMTLKDPHLAQGIQRIAEQKEVSDVLIGKERGSFRNIFKPTLIEQLTSTGLKISIQPLPGNAPQKKIRQIPLLSYLYVTLGVGALGSLFYFLAPQLSYKIADFLFLLIISLLLGIQIWRTKRREQLLIKRELSTRAIYDIVKEIATAPSKEQVFTRVKKQTGAILNGTCEIILGHEELLFDKGFDKKDQAIATWVFHNGKEAGWSTSTLSSAHNLYIPLSGFKERVGVLSYHPHHETPLSIEETHFFYTVAKQLAHYIERSRAETQEKEHLFLGKAEKIYNRVLHALTSELESPIKTLEKAHATLEQQVSPLLGSAVEQIENAADLLTRIRTNASAMEKLSTGFIQFHISPQNVYTLIHNCQKKMKKALKGHRLNVHVPTTLPPLPCDPSLMEILLTNLLLNAAEYSPAGTTIEIEAECTHGSLVLSVTDEGPGIPEELIDKIFEKFYKAPGDTTAGLGLGLAIVSSIATLHQGEIRVQNRPSGGAKFILILPLKVDS